MRAFADALDAVPTALAENSGYEASEMVALVKGRHVTENNPRLGIDCNGLGTHGTSHITSPNFNPAAQICANSMCSTR
jgi:T-complex protein 1 subunit epsilon